MLYTACGADQASTLPLIAAGCELKHKAMSRAGCIDVYVAEISTARQVRGGKFKLFTLSERERIASSVVCA